MIVFLNLQDFNEYHISFVNAHTNDLCKNPFIPILINATFFTHEYEL